MATRFFTIDEDVETELKQIDKELSILHFLFTSNKTVPIYYIDQFIELEKRKIKLGSLLKTNQQSK